MLEERAGSGAARRIRMMVLPALLVGLALALSGCGAGPGGSAEEAAGGPTREAGTEQGTATKPGPATQTSEGGEVTVEVTWKGESAGPVFDVTMDTHSVDLDAYDLRKQAVLRNDRGLEVRAKAWDAPKGGHHREGVLDFPEKTAGGKDLIGPNTRRVELIIRDVAGVQERSFEWNL